MIKNPFNNYSYLCISFALFCALILLFIGCTKRGTEDYEQTCKFFKDPPNSCLPTVYWFWNGDITHEKIKWQLEEIKRSNTVGAVCILAWEGLTTEYLSDEWFNKIKYACEIAKTLKLEIWLYDEFCWPSGYAGGKIIQLNPAYNAKCLSRTERRMTGPEEISIEITKKTVVIIAGSLKDEKLNEQSLIDLTGNVKNNVFSWSIPQGEWLISFYKMECNDFRPTFSNMEYVDLLDADAVKKFIKITHDEYYNRMPEYFGDVIKAIITDEPGIYCNLKPWNINPETIPWTPSFFKAFELRKGYDLRKYLPAIWNDIGDNTAKIRTDYYDVFSDLLQESYFKPLHDWCNDHNIKLNIQPVHEETLKFTTLMQGDYFRAMEYSHLPGADEVYSWDKNLITPKIASSAARMFGSQNVYCEVFAAYG